ncbi:MAG: DUF433 domain-containing protein [Salinibacter sp.]|uniref:DUF433 domain-containing protein n=1 Tax=Salinibacter sp. TaxID=2065818 RepID=UPI0035D411F5
MEQPYVEQDDTGYRIVGTRVSLESVVYAFREGCSPETIAGECFPTLTLEQVYGAIAYYLAHRTDIDAYLERVEATREEERTAHADPDFARKMKRARKQRRAQDV